MAIITEILNTIYCLHQNAYKKQGDLEFVLKMVGAVLEFVRKMGYAVQEYTPCFGVNITENKE